MKNQLLMTVILLLLGLGGCALPRLPEIGQTLAVPTPSPPPPAAPSALATVPLPPVDELIQRQLYTVTMVDMDLGEALAAVSRYSPVPIVAEQAAVGKVNLVLKKVPMSEALQAIIKPLGYTARVENGIIIVGRPRLVTRPFFISYLRDKRTFSSSTNASISSGSGAETTTSSSSGTSTSGRQGNVNVTTAGSTDFWSGLLKGLEGIVFGDAGKGERSSGKKIVYNDLAGVVYITDTEENLEIVSAFLADIEREIKRQVLIQAHIVEIDLKDQFSLGIDWKYILSKASTTISQGLLPTPQSNVFKVNINSSDFSLLLDAFKEQGHVNMLSSPKIATMNNQKAVIKLTTKEVTWVTSTTINATGDILTTSTEPQVDEVGLFLDVTPNIDANGVITMHIHPSISEIKEISVAPDGESGSKPVINVREVDTIVDVKSGQTVVIAGLISERIRENKRSIPFLGDIPYVGLLFSNLSQERKKAELVIFLTPFVLEDRTIEQIRTDHESRIRALDSVSRYLESQELVAAKRAAP